MGQVFKQRLCITAEACIAAALMLLAVPLKWILGWTMAAVCHESFHCLALWICGKQVDQIRIDWNGAQIHTEDLQPWETAACALAGPLGSLLLLLPGRGYPEFAVCVVVQSLFNLLPLSFLDGGRALGGLLGCVFSQNVTEKLCDGIEVILLILLLTAGAAAVFCLKMGMLPLILAIAAVTKSQKRKIPCKWRFLKVQ